MLSYFGTLISWDVDTTATMALIQCILHTWFWTLTILNNNMMIYLRLGVTYKRHLFSVCQE